MNDIRPTPPPFLVDWLLSVLVPFTWFVLAVAVISLVVWFVVRAKGWEVPRLINQIVAGEAIAAVVLVITVGVLNIWR